MASFDEKDVAIMIKYLTIGDDYDEAMKHFLSKAGGAGLMDQSVPLPLNMKDNVQEIYGMAVQKINAMFGLGESGLISSIRFFYISQYNLVHGTLVSKSVYGATIYFPNLEKGALAILRTNDPETHFVRISAFRQSAGDA